MILKLCQEIQSVVKKYYKLSLTLLAMILDSATSDVYKL